MTNLYQYDPFFAKRSNPKSKMTFKKNDFSVGDLMGWTPDQRSKSTENSYFFSLESYRAWASMMPIRILHIR